MLVNTKLPPSGIAALAKKILKSADKCEQVVYNRKKRSPNLVVGFHISYQFHQKELRNTKT